jgi:hypothetical protein
MAAGSRNADDRHCPTDGSGQKAPQPGGPQARVAREPRKPYGKQPTRHSSSQSNFHCSLFVLIKGPVMQSRVRSRAGQGFAHPAGLGGVAARILAGSASGRWCARPRRPVAGGASGQRQGLFRLGDDQPRRGARSASSTHHSRSVSPTGRNMCSRSPTPRGNRAASAVRAHGRAGSRPAGRGAAPPETAQRRGGPRPSASCTRRRERAMLRFRRMRSLQKFASVHGSIYNHFNQERALYSRSKYKANRAAALVEWRGLLAA